jgi:glutamine amidotransferase
LFYLVRKHPFDTAKLSDEDVSFDFSQVTTPNDRVAIIVTQPLTTNEQWTAFASGELKLFIDGVPQAVD